MDWIRSAIGNLCLETGQRDPRRSPGDYFKYVDIATVDKDKKTIENPSLILGSEAPSRARKEIMTGDVLVSTVRPNLNAVTIVPSELDGEIASTGFCVLRANPKLLNSKYLFYWTTTSEFIDYLVSNVRGANYPAVTDGIVKNTIIPLPSISEQRRIVEILNQADALRKKRAEADEKSDRILPALFIKMFGDPVDNPKELPEVELGKVIAEGPQNGLYKHASFYGEGTPILRIDSFYEGIVDTSKEFRRLKLTADEVEKYKLNKNDIVINRVNGSRELFGKSALVPEFSEVTIFESNMMKFSVDTKIVHPVYIIRHLQTPAIKQQMLNKGKHINQYSINQGDIRSLKILLPPFSTQESFASRVTKIQNTLGSQANNHVKLEQLFELLLHRAFSGDLTAEWRKAHMKELLQEMEHQSKVLGIPHTVEPKQLGLSLL
jgi:type I restriction enzyme, S subunit